MEKINIFKRKKVVWGFALASLIGAVAFANKGITGNSVLNEGATFNPVSLIGILLIICFVILVIYYIKSN